MGRRARHWLIAVVTGWRNGYNNGYRIGLSDVERLKEAEGGGEARATAVAATIASLKVRAGLRVDADAEAYLQQAGEIIAAEAALARALALERMGTVRGLAWLRWLARPAA